MTTRHQQQTPNKNVGGTQLTDDQARQPEDSPAQREAARRASEPGIDLGPDSELLADTDPAHRISANKRGGGGHGGTSRDRERGQR
jgi:hypothetical protein